MFASLLVAILLTGIQGMPIFDTTNNQISTIETSTVTTQIVKDTTTEQTVLITNATSGSVNTTAIINISNLTVTGNIQSGMMTRNINGRAANETNGVSGSLDFSETGLGEDAIMGIVVAVVGVFALIITCFIVTICCIKSEGRQSRKVVVQQ